MLLYLSTVLQLLIAGFVDLSLCVTDNVVAPELFDSPYEYIVQNAPNRLKLLMDIYLRNQTSHELIDYFAPIESKNELCQNQSLFYKASFKNFDSWAVKMFDSSGKIPSGILDRNFFELGNYQECLDIPKSGPYEVKYCIIEVKNLLPSPIYHREFMESNVFMFGGIALVKGNFYIARCVPATCEEEDLENYYAYVAREYDVSVEVGKFSCTASNATNPYTALDWFCVIFLTATVLLIISATFVHTYQVKDTEKGPLISLLLCFSLYINFYQIFTRDHLKSKLSFLSGLRGLSMVLIMLGHMAICLAILPLNNVLTYSQEYTKPTISFALVCAFNSAVDNFFIIGGLLISYLQIKNKKIGRKFNLKLYYMRRFLRIYPPYISQILLFVTLIYRYGDGPIWKNMFGPTRDNCLKYWWTNLLFINNYLHQDKMCISTNWYLAVDMQLYILGPLFLFLLIKSKIFRYYGIQLLIIVSDLWTFYDSYVNKYRAGSIVDLGMRNEQTNQYVYVTTQSRFSCWLLGLYLGYRLQKIEDDPKNKIIPKVTLWIGWTLTAVVQVLAVLAMRDLMSSTKEHDNLIDSLYNGFHRTIFAMSICWIIYACELGYGGFLYDFLTLYPLQIMGRLSFAAYMSQLIVLLGIDGTTLTSLQYNKYFKFRDSLSNIIICFMASAFLSVMFELPYSNIGRVLTAGMSKAPSKTEQDNEMKEAKGSNIKKDKEENA